MSEQAKPVCVLCGMPIVGKARGAGHGNGLMHSSGQECVMALRRELAALRAALDQEREKVAALREVIEFSGEWLPNSHGKLIFQFGGGWIANDETLALLSGRGEGAR